jgi:alkylmercury lyase
MVQSQIVRAEAAVAALFPRLDPEEERIARTLYRLLALGQPVALAELAKGAPADPEAVAAALGSWHGVHRDAVGAVTGFWGLTLDATPHRLRVAGRTLHAWCAWDTFFIPALLESTADVESTCPATGATLHLVVAPERLIERPADVVMSFITPERAQIQADVVRHFCSYVRFFASAGVTRDWQNRNPGTFLVALEEAWRLARVKLAAQFPSFATSDASRA